MTSISTASSEPLPLNWSGMLTVNNAEQVADLLRRFIGDSRYTFVAARAEGWFEPDVRTGQRLKADRGCEPIVFHRHSTRHVQILIGDSYGVSSLMSTTTNDAYDPDFKAPYLCFGRRQVRITHRVPCGDVVHWIYALEPEERAAL